MPPSDIQPFSLLCFLYYGARRPLIAAATKSSNHFFGRPALGFRRFSTRRVAWFRSWFTLTKRPAPD